MTFSFEEGHSLNFAEGWGLAAVRTSTCQGLRLADGNLPCCCSCATHPGLCQCVQQEGGVPPQPGLPGSGLHCRKEVSRAPAGELQAASSQQHRHLPRALPPGQAGCEGCALTGEQGARTCCNQGILTVRPASAPEQGTSNHSACHQGRLKVRSAAAAGNGRARRTSRMPQMLRMTLTTRSNSSAWTTVWKVSMAAAWQGQL